MEVNGRVAEWSLLDGSHDHPLTHPESTGHSILEKMREPKVVVHNGIWRNRQ